MQLILEGSGCLVMSLSTNQEFPGSIPDSAVGFFSNRELFHGIYGVAFSAFHSPLFMFYPVLSSEQVPAQVRGDLQFLSMFLLYVIHRYQFS